MAAAGDDIHGGMKREVKTSTGVRKKLRGKSQKKKKVPFGTKRKELAIPGPPAKKKKLTLLGRRKKEKKKGHWEGKEGGKAKK